ncbi:MAG: PTS fructose transporter subunit IIA [Duodenibacillus sp.]|nr:PTS fructose transporter subunit IIA [Duodenibacillus sp.]
MPSSIFIIAHAPLASALKDCAVHVYSHDVRVGDFITAVDVAPDADTQTIADSVAAKLASDGSQGRKQHLLLTDLAGATPANIAASLLKFEGVALLSGVNLPMVLTAVCHREEAFDKLIEHVRQAGTDSITQLPAA